MDNQETQSGNQRTKIRIKVTTNTDLKFVISALKSDKVKDLFKIIKDVYQEVVNCYGYKTETKDNERREVQITSIRLGDYAVSLHQTIGDIIRDYQQIFCQAVQRKIVSTKPKHNKKEIKEAKVINKANENKNSDKNEQNKSNGKVRQDVVQNIHHSKQESHKKKKNKTNKEASQVNSEKKNISEKKQKVEQKSKSHEKSSVKKQPRIFDPQFIKKIIKDKIIGSQD